MYFSPHTECIFDPHRVQGVFFFAQSVSEESKGRQNGPLSVEQLEDGLFSYLIDIINIKKTANNYGLPIFASLNVSIFD